MSELNLGSCDARLILDLMKISAETTKSLVETARLQYETSAKLIEAGTVNMAAGAETPSGSSTVSPSRPALKVQVFGEGMWAGRARNCRMALDERAGSITMEMWEALSAEKLKEIDSVLRKIVRKLCSKDGDGAIFGGVIQEELATCGLVFASASDLGKTGKSNNWEQAKDVTLTSLARTDHAVDFFRQALGGWCYSHEMWRVVQRLMELRGFEV